MRRTLSGLLTVSSLMLAIAAPAAVARDVLDFSPAINAKADATAPIYGYFEQTGKSFDVSKVKLFVAGKDVTNQSVITSKFFAYKPAQPLSGNVEVKIQYPSDSGTILAGSWTYSAGSRLVANAPATQQPATTLSTKPASEGTATTSTTETASTSTASTTPQSVAAASIPLEPDFTSHANGAAISSQTFTLKGKTKPNAQVQIRVRTEQPAGLVNVLLGGGGSSSTVSTTATADAQGVFSANINTETFKSGSQINVEATAKLDGKTSSPTRLNLVQR